MGTVAEAAQESLRRTRTKIDDDAQATQPIEGLINDFAEEMSLCRQDLADRVS